MEPEAGSWRQLIGHCRTRSCANSPRMFTAITSVNGHAQFVRLELPDGARWRLVVAVDGVVEVHHAFLHVPIQSIGQLHPLRSKQLHHRLAELVSDMCSTRYSGVFR